MDKSVTTILPYSGGGLQQRPRSKKGRFVRSALALFIAAACGYAALLSTFTSTTIHSAEAHIPINAQEVIHKCTNINLIPGPPTNFHSREQSDRYVSGTKPTLIKNATIWTGDVDGLEVVLGDVLLDKGIIKAAGEVDEGVVNAYEDLSVVDAKGAWVFPGIVDLHSHIGVGSAPSLSGSSDTNSRKGIVQPWLRSLDGLNTHDESYRLSISGGVTTAAVLPGSANAIGGQAFVIKLRSTKERSPSSMLLEPPFTFNGSGIEEVYPPRWRLLKQACGENPSRVYSGTRMDTIWAFREGYEKARKIKVQQDAYCEKALAGQWQNLGEFPDDLQWEALVDVLRGKVKIQNHCYEAVDLDGIVRLTNEFKFSIAAFHHAHETYLVPDLLKKAYGHPPAIALFATNARYKRESYRGSEFAPRVLADNGLSVVMKSDHSVLNSRYLLHEAQQAHYYGLPPNLALASVTSTPARIMGQGHRIGFVKQGYDADLIIWDSHPLSLGATPKQVYIDGIPQIATPYVKEKPEKLQRVPQTPDFDREVEETVKFEGLPPLGVEEEGGKGSVKEGVVVLENVGSVFLKKRAGVEEVFMKQEAGRSGVVVVRRGKVVCMSGNEAGSEEVCGNIVNDYAGGNVERIDLKGGSIAPGLITYGSSLGLSHISGESSTQDGPVLDVLSSSNTLPTLLGPSPLIQAIDGLQFSARNALLAYRHGVVAGITPPQTSSGGFLSGLSTAFRTGVVHKLVRGAVVKDVVAVHVGVSLSSGVSVSTQVGVLRRLLVEGKDVGGEVGKWFGEVVKGNIPLVISVENADIMATLITLKSEVEASYSKKIRLVFTGASEAHLLAKEIGEAGIGVIVVPTRPFPKNWERLRILPGPPLTQESAITALLANNVTVGVGASDTWNVRNTRFDVGWAALESGGTISKADAIALATTNIEKLLGLSSGFDFDSNSDYDADSEETGGIVDDLVVTTGGTILDFEAKVVGVVSPTRGVVDLF